MQKNWKVCTTNGDPNHNIVMKMCPATCAMARGDACPKAAPVLSAASKAKIISAVKKANAKKLAKKVAPKKVKAVKKVVKKVAAKKVPAVKKLVKMISAKKVKAVLKKHVRLTRDPVRVAPRLHVLTRDPVRKQTGIVSSAHPKGNRGGVNHTAVRVARIGQFGTKSFLDSRAAFKQAQDARAIFRSRQKVLADKRNSESEIYFKSLAVYIKAKAVAVKAKEDLKVAKDAHDLAKKTHRLSLAELAKLRATRVTADAAVDETKKKLVEDKVAAADAKTKSAA